MKRQEKLKLKSKLLLTNLPENIMTTEDICEIYHQRWGIETNYNTLKKTDTTSRTTLEKDA